MNTEKKALFETIIGRYPRRKSAVMPVMQLLQKENGDCLSAEAMEATGRTIGMSKSRVFGIASYYTMFNTSLLGNTIFRLTRACLAFFTGPMRS